jgi:hypothetical protein
MTRLVCISWKHSLKTYWGLKKFSIGFSGASRRLGLFEAGGRGKLSYLMTQIDNWG